MAFYSVMNYIKTDYQSQVQTDIAEKKLHVLAGLYNWYLKYADLLVTQDLTN